MAWRGWLRPHYCTLHINIRSNFCVCVCVCWRERDRESKSIRSINSAIFLCAFQPVLSCLKWDFVVPSEIRVFVLVLDPGSFGPWTLRWWFLRVHRLSKHGFTVQMCCGLHACITVLSPPQIQMFRPFCPQVNNCRFEDVKDLCFGAADTWVFKP